MVIPSVWTDIALLLSFVAGFVIAWRSPRYSGRSALGVLVLPLSFLLFACFGVYSAATYSSQFAVEREVLASTQKIATVNAASGSSSVFVLGSDRGTYDFYYVNDEGGYTSGAIPKMLATVYLDTATPIVEMYVTETKCLPFKSFWMDWFLHCYPWGFPKTRYVFHLPENAVIREFNLAPVQQPQFIP